VSEFTLTPLLDVVVVPVFAVVVPLTTVSPALRPLVISAIELVTRPTCTDLLATVPLVTTWTVYPAVEEPESAVAGTRRTLSTEAVVTVTVALMPARTVSGGLVRVIVTAYVATLEPPPVELAATGTI